VKRKDDLFVGRTEHQTVRPEDEAVLFDGFLLAVEFRRDPVSWLDYYVGQLAGNSKLEAEAHIYRGVLDLPLSVDVWFKPDMAIIDFKTEFPVS
jgi:hypothetical protein